MAERIPSDDRPVLSPELCDLVQKVAGYPHGLGFLHLATLETIAITLGVSPYVADRARAMLATDEGRSVLIEEVRRAKGRASGSTDHPGAPGPPGMSSGTGSPANSTGGTVAPSPPATAATVEELVQRALEHPLGIRFLLDAPMEVVAITLRAHAFLVLETRELLQQRYGLEGHPEEDGDA